MKTCSYCGQDDYYQYCAPLLREGSNPGSGGVMIKCGYAHIALPFHHGQVRSPLVHELAHNCVAHLPLPLWRNEGVAQRLQRFVVPARQGILNAEQAAEHRSFWTEPKIQGFWAGTSFHDPDGDGRSLSYSLAEVLVHLLLERQHGFLEFLGRAHYNDAGQTAALCPGPKPRGSGYDISWPRRLASLSQSHRGSVGASQAGGSRRRQRWRKRKRTRQSVKGAENPESQKTQKTAENEFFVDGRGFTVNIAGRTFRTR